MHTTLNLSLREQRAHEAELLARIRSAARRSTLPALFGGSSPRWAEEALFRLEAGGKARERDDGTLEVLATS